MADPITAAVAVGWGMKAVGWFASPVISELFKKGSSILGFNASDKLRVLGPKVLLLERVIELVEESPYRPHLEQLFNELKSIFHEAEDILDDVEYHHLERQIHDDKFKSADGGQPMVRTSELIMDKIQFALPRSPLKHKVNSRNWYAQREVEEGTGENGREAVATNLHTTGTPPLKVVGRDEDRDKIIAMLHDKEGDDPSDANSSLCYSVVGIHGISGSGKTTLAQLVYEQEKKYMQEEKGDHFDLVLWANVSQNFSARDIYREMNGLASHNLWGGRLASHDSQGDRSFIAEKELLEYRLHDKRFFLVLDDVWCNSKDASEQNLPQLLAPLKVGKRGSKVLVTCRDADALSDLGPDVKTTHFPIHDLNDIDFHKLFMYYALGDRATDDHDSSTLWSIGAHIAAKLKRSPLAASMVGGQLRRRKNVEYWRRAIDQDLLNETMGALSWSYQHLDVQVRRCFAYCSLFPVGHHLIRDELVRLWVAEGFIRKSYTGKLMEDVGHEYFDELVSTSFLQLGTERYYDYYIMHDLLHHLAERVAGSDCFRIEDGWKGEVPRGVRHLFVNAYNEEIFSIVGRSIGLENLRTLIVSTVGLDCLVIRIEGKVLKSMLERLRKLRVLSIGLIRNKTFLLPVNIDLLKHLRFLALRMGGPSCRLVISPRSFSKLHHLQTLGFSHCNHLLLSSDEELVNLVNLRYATTNLFAHLNISRLTSLQKLPSFSIHKYKLKQLRGLNKIHGSLRISDLYLVETKEEALEAKLADKGRLTKLELSWCRYVKNPHVQAEVLEGLCPPTCLEELSIEYYNGATYPNWMVGKQSGGPKYLQELEFSECAQIGPVPELFEVFAHLRSFTISFCDSWDALPDTIGHLKSLKKLNIYKCMSIQSLPVLPQSLQTFQLDYCDEAFMRSCQTIGDPNWQKIKHIATRKFLPVISGSPSNSNRLKGVAFDDNVSIIGE